MSHLHVPPLTTQGKGSRGHQIGRDSHSLAKPHTKASMNAKLHQHAAEDPSAAGAAGRSCHSALPAAAAMHTCGYSSSWDQPHPASPPHSRAQCSSSRAGTAPAAAPPKLVVDAPRLVALRADDMQASEAHHLGLLVLAHVPELALHGLPEPARVYQGWIKDAWRGLVDAQTP